jgi:hypothetical protein
MAVFISYARKDAALADLLRQDVERAKRDAWIDRELTGGQDWWDTILGQIRQCNVFVFALSPDSLRSKACMAELHYALALGRPLLPVMVRDVTVQLAPPEIANAQIVDYRERSVDNAFALVNALAAAPPPPALPEPLPPAPPVPMSYMNTYRERIEADSLTYREQSSLFVELRDHVRDDDGRETALQLLRELRRRPDIVESVAQQVDALLANPPPVDDPLTPSGGGSSSPATPAGWYHDPAGRYELRYWDGAAWTDHVASGGQQFLDAPGAPAGGGTAPTSTATATASTATATPTTTTPAPTTPGDQPWDTTSFVLLVLATVFCAGLVGVIVGAINLKRPARKNQAQILLIVGIVMIVIGILVAVAAAGSSSSSTG